MQIYFYVLWNKFNKTKAHVGHPGCHTLLCAAAPLSQLISQVIEGGSWVPLSLQHGWIITSHRLFWDIIAHPCHNFNSSLFRVRAWISNYIPYKTMWCNYLSTLSSWLNYHNKRDPWTERLGACICVQAWMSKLSHPSLSLSSKKPGLSKMLFGDLLCYIIRHNLTTSLSAFSWMKNSVFWFKFHWSLFLEVHVTIIPHWFR